MKRVARTLAVGAAFALAAGVASLAVGMAVSAVYAAMGLAEPVPSWLERLNAAGNSPGERARIIASVAGGALLLAPLAEEALFRGLLQGWLMRRMRIAWAVALTALLFAAAHGSVYSFAPLVAVSVCFSMARIKGGGLAAPIVAHALYNAAALAAALASRAAS